MLSKIRLVAVHLALVTNFHDHETMFTQGICISHCCFNLLNLDGLQLEHHGVVLEFWKKSLNLLTWIEILCQVLTAAGFGSKLNMTRKAACIKVFNSLINMILFLFCGLLCHSVI